jgi:hypothetical protein
MTRDQAIAVRTRALNGEQVSAPLLARATELLSRPVTPRSNNRKFCLPTLPAKEKEYANAILAFNLGRAIGGRA